MLTSLSTATPVKFVFQDLRKYGIDQLLRNGDPDPSATGVNDENLVENDCFIVRTKIHKPPSRTSPMFTWGSDTYVRGAILLALMFQLRRKGRYPFDQ